MHYKNNRKKRKIIIISIIAVVIIALIIGIVLFLFLKKKNNVIKYEDKIINKNFFNQIEINFETKKVKRDNRETSLREEFEMTEDKEKQILSDKEELINYFNDTVYELSFKDDYIFIKNIYQTKKILIEAESIQDDLGAKSVNSLQDGLFVLEFNSQKETKDAYENFKNQSWVKNVQLDEVWIINSINDESQTVYGEENVQNEIKYNTFGIGAMGIDNYKKIIEENGNPFEVVISTLGYGVRFEHSYFKDRIHENSYNFILESKDINETIPQGSRIAEVLVESTPNNVKIMPLVVVDKNGYTTVSSIASALEYGMRNSNVICYELIHKKNHIIDLVLQNAFKENVPVSCVTTVEEKETQNYPASNETTIAVSSIDKNAKLSTYSGKGEFIDFAAFSTDVKELLDTNIGVSRWSGAQYSNAHIVAQIALIKSYKKDFSIMQIYNVLKNYSKDIGEKGKDKLYGYGFPDFSKLKISDLDKENPIITEVKFDNETWEKSKQIQIIASDNIRVLGWAITKSDAKPDKWNEINEIRSTLDITTEIKDNGKYYVWVTDSAGNAVFNEIEINKIDYKPPTINYSIDVSKIDIEKYVTININAQDSDSGLHEMAYSWDGVNWGADRNILKVTENGRYTVYVRDVMENVESKVIEINSFPREGIATVGKGKIIKNIVVSSSWNGDINNGVRITFNKNLNIIGWNITTSKNVPKKFEEIEDDTFDDDNNNQVNEQNELENTNDTNIIYNLNETNDISQGYNMNYTITRTLKTGITYYAWIKDANNNVKYQSFSISKVEI